MTQDEFCLEISHRVYYSNKQPIPIHEVASSLLALESIILRLPSALTAVTSVPINKIEVYVEELQSGSLLEDIIIKLAFKDQQGLDDFLLKIREQLGQRKVTRNVLISARLSPMAFIRQMQQQEILRGLRLSTSTIMSSSILPQENPASRRKNWLILSVLRCETRKQMQKMRLLSSSQPSLTQVPPSAWEISSPDWSWHRM
ncbi:hypothetical protein [Laribacter hongkongensis]|uniref:hypothetical protein n=1 Tax=Laribacter hongkongensis TaxID=168471 RepID=UPI001EFEDDF0|nr:hypothetical protein [Laribacter hongkongensis]MCG9093984.1 hypothetical protein [Laribacter hongkongensis]